MPLLPCSYLKDSSYGKEASEFYWQCVGLSFGGLRKKQTMAYIKQFQHVMLEHINPGTSWKHRRHVQIFECTRDWGTLQFHHQERHNRIGSSTNERGTRGRFAPFQPRCSPQPYCDLLRCVVMTTHDDLGCHGFGLNRLLTTAPCRNCRIVPTREICSTRMFRRGKWECTCFSWRAAKQLSPLQVSHLESPLGHFEDLVQSIEPP